MKRSSSLRFRSPAKGGFTLIELMIVIVIIGILAVALLPRLIGAPAKARDVARKTDLNDLVNALELYSSDSGFYPGTLGTTTCLTTSDAVSALIDNYLQELPMDPTLLASSGECKTGSATGAYSYRPLGTGTATGYMLTANLEGETTSEAEGIYCISELNIGDDTNFATFTSANTTLDKVDYNCSSSSSNGYYIILK